MVLPQKSLLSLHFSETNQERRNDFPKLTLLADDEPGLKLASLVLRTLMLSHQAVHDDGGMSMTGWNVAFGSKELGFIIYLNYIKLK